MGQKAKASESGALEEDAGEREGAEETVESDAMPNGVSDSVPEPAPPTAGQGEEDVDPDSEALPDTPSVNVRPIPKGQQKRSG